MAGTTKYEAATPFRTSFAKSIEVSGSSETKVRRGGYDVPEVKVNLDKAAAFLDGLKPVGSEDTPRVFSQTPEAGTPALPGSIIRVILVPKGSIPFGTLQDVHADFQDRTVDAVDEILANPKIREAVLTYEDPADVPPEIREMIIAALAKLKPPINVVETDPRLTFNKAWGALRAAAAFR
jgi:hypothetical protein